METIAKEVVQNWAAKGYISDDEVEMCLYNLIRHTFTVAVLCVLTVVGALLGEWSNTIVLIVSILFLRTYTNGYHCKSCVACIFLSLAVTLLSLHIVPLLNFITALILMFVGSSIILAIAPTNSPQMHLTETEMTAMRKHVRIRLLILTILFLLFVFVNMEKAYCIAVAVAVVAISLLAVRCKSQ
jgi:accessory gene regulator protein AgrB